MRNQAQSHTRYFIMENESYKDAAQHYEHAWKFSNKANPSIVYWFAFYYRKAKSFTDAVNVCLEIIDIVQKYVKKFCRS